MKKIEKKEMILGARVTGKKNYALKVRVSKQEFEKIKKKAEELGLKVTQFIRMCSLHAKVDKEFIRTK